MQDLNLEIISLCEVGSRLYGTATASSDKDYRGVYKASMRDILLNKAKESISQNSKSSSENRRNTSEDVDIEYKELRKFVNDALAGQVYCYDLLFANENSSLRSSEIWEELISNREKLLSSNVAPLIGYCRKQAGRYSLKGSRLNELERLQAFLVSQEKELRLSQVISAFESSPFIEVSEKHIKVLGKIYFLNNSVQYLLNAVEKTLSKFSVRSKLAANAGGYDFKAISHAFRSIFQAKQLLSEGIISFPSPKAELLLKIKQGQIEGEKLIFLLGEELDSIESVINSSILPPEPDYLFWENWLCEIYLN